MPKLIPLTSLTEKQTEQLWQLYQHEWWSNDRSLADVTRMLEHSQLVFGYAEPDGTLVAFARVLTDRRYRAYLLDVIVAPAYRHCGLGRRLLHRITSDPILVQVEMLVLSCRPELVDFYRSVGFKTSEHGIVSMRLQRPPQPASSPVE